METGSPALEAIWSELRPHVEWAPGFTLVFLFTSHPKPVEFLRKRLSESLQLRTLRLSIVAPHRPAEVERSVEEILAARPDPGRGPLWVELWQGSAEEGWREARRQALHRLNERRFLLERDVRLPTVLVLPQDERGQVYIAAPDLWAVRSFTAELPAPVEAPKVAEISPKVERPVVLGSPPGPTELEWARLLERTTDAIRLDLRDGFAAFESAVERGDLAAGRTIANQTLDIARRRLQTTGDTPQALRDLSISLDNVGQVEGDLGNLEAARTAYRESLELLRQLREAVGETPQALRDLSVSLNNVGQVERDLGNLEVARTAYRESLELRRRLARTFPDRLATSRSWRSRRLG